MITDIHEEIGIIEKYHLSPAELFITRIFLLLQENGEDTYLRRYLAVPEKDRGDLREVLISLQAKGVILKNCKIPNKGESFDPYTIEFNKVFIKGFFKASFEMGKELFETYPMFGQINGCITSLRGVSKKFNSLEDAYIAYGKAIGWNPDKHNRIIELLKWAQDNTSFIQFSLATFIIDQKWNELEALQNGDLVNVNFNSIKSI